MRSRRSHRRRSLVAGARLGLARLIVAGFVTLLASRPAGAQQWHYCGDPVTTATDVLATVDVWTRDGQCKGTLPANFAALSATEQRTVLSNALRNNAGAVSPVASRRRCRGDAGCPGGAAWIEAKMMPINDVHKVRPLAIPAAGVIIGGVRVTNKSGGAPYDTLTGVGALIGEETYLIVRKDAVYRATVEFARYVPTGAGGFSRSDNVRPGFFGVCEVLHGPWPTAAAEFWSCDHAHRWLRCLNPAEVSADSIYKVLHLAKPPDCPAAARARKRGAHEGDAREPLADQSSLFRTAAFTSADARRPLSVATLWPRARAFFQTDLDDPGWMTCALGCCAVYR